MSAIWTIGHSVRPIEEFIDLLKAHAIELVCDVRRFPGSRRHPHFGQDALAASLAEAGMEYAHFPDLGGRRQPRPDSANTAWRNRGFRGYADYIETDAFREAVDRLRAITRKKRGAIMCAEANWHSCHRSLLSDYLKADGMDVRHITSATRAEPHRYTNMARIVGGRLTYREEELRLF
jgi:uncharacterized protein (DUF488 family)